MYVLHSPPAYLDDEAEQPNARGSRRPTQACWCPRTPTTSRQPPNWTAYEPSARRPRLGSPPDGGGKATALLQYLLPMTDTAAEIGR